MIDPRSLRGRLLSLVDDFAGLRVAVFGDLIVDEFIYGQISRVSREAPVLILEYDSTELVPGGAGNAANNVAALGGRAAAIGVTGQDEPGRRLIDAMAGRIDVRGVITHSGLITPTKTRILAGGVHSAKQQVVRVDRAPQQSFPDDLRERLARRFASVIGRCDALLVSDYGTGLVLPSVVSAAQKFLRSPGKRRAPVLVDSRDALLKFRRMTTCTPNESEVEQLLGVKIGENSRVLERAGRELLTRTAAAALLITRGSRGMALFQPERPTVHIPIFGSDQIADVTGAGDTVIATMTLALAAGASYEEAAHLANYAGGLVVMKRGTATITAEELKSAIRSDAARANPVATRPPR